MGKEKSAESSEIQGDSGLDQVVKDMPIPSADVVPQESPKVGKEKIRDPKGREFDPDLHLTNPDGTPKINKKTGNLCMRPGPEKIKKNKGRFGVQVEDQVKEVPQAASDTRMAAEASVDAISQIGVACFGGEWQFVKSDSFDERVNLVNVTEKYYAVKGVRDIPPGVAFWVAMGGYVLRRMAVENTRSKFSRIVDSIKIKVWKVFNSISRMFKKGGKNVSYADPRSNGVRQDNTRGEAGAEVQESTGSGSSPRS